MLNLMISCGSSAQKMAQTLMNLEHGRDILIYPFLYLFVPPLRSPDPRSPLSLISCPISQSSRVFATIQSSPL
ncbi:hypothetical protein BDN71DRAFT_1457419, partial [Pleurotus eryngii]